MSKTFDLDLRPEWMRKKESIDSFIHPQKSSNTTPDLYEPPIDMKKILKTATDNDKREKQVVENVDVAYLKKQQNNTNSTKSYVLSKDSFDYDYDMLYGDPDEEPKIPTNNDGNNTGNKKKKRQKPNFEYDESGAIIFKKYF